MSRESPIQTSFGGYFLEEKDYRGGSVLERSGHKEFRTTFEYLKLARVRRRGK